MVQVELDSFYVKFKHLLRAEKDATLTLKSEAGRAFVTLSLDLGHVYSGQGEVPREPRNGLSRQRRREKREAARDEKKAAENCGNTSSVEAEESEENVKGTSTVEKPDAEEASELETKPVAEKATETAEEVPFIEEEFCSDSTYRNEPKEMKSIETQTIEAGIRPSTTSKPGFDYYTLRYDDTDSE